MLCVLTLFSLSACSSKEKTFSELYLENATPRNVVDGEITAVEVYTDSDGGELVEISVKKKNKDGYYETKDYYMVVSDITFDADKIELTSSESSLYGSSVKACNGKTVEKGYFLAVPDLFDFSNTSSDYEVIMTWKLFQAEESDKEYNIEKINKLVADNLNQE